MIRKIAATALLALASLAADFREQGPFYAAIAGNYRLRDREVNAIAVRLEELDQRIAADCRAGRYRFDLSPVVILGGAEVSQEASCD